MKRLLPLLLLLISAAALAESGAYRVEIIIFRNLAVSTDPDWADPDWAEELRSFSQFPALEDADLPDDLVAIARKSSSMDAIWRRLKSSGEYQPLLFAAWQQNRTDYYPPMRIHDEMLLDEQLRPPTNIMIADLAAADPLGAYVSSLYRLDGSLQLRRSRFLHLYLDLEYRQETPQPGTQLIFFNANEPAPPDGNGNRNNISKSMGYSVYSLQQHRQIRTGHMQYFDTPFLGALVLVNAIDSE